MFKTIQGAYHAGRLVAGQGNPPSAQKAKPTQPTPSVPAAAPTAFNIPAAVTAFPLRKDAKNLETVSQAISAAGAQLNTTVQSYGNAGNSDIVPGGTNMDLKAASDKISDSQEEANMGSPMKDV